MAVTAEHEAHTFRMQSLSHLFGGILMVATAVILAVVIGVQTSQSILFRTIFGLGCLLYAWFGERLARARVEVHDSRLIAHDYLRTRTVNASDIREITWEWWRKGSTFWVVPRVILADGASIRLSGLWAHRSRHAEQVTIVEEILSLLGIHVPVEGHPSDQAPDQDPGSPLPGVQVPVQEQVPDRVPDQASAPVSVSGLGGDSPVGLPGDYVGAPRPPRALRPPRAPRPPWQFRKGFLHWLPIMVGLTLGVLYIVSPVVRVLVILLYCALALRSLIRLATGSWRSRRARPQPSSRQS